MYYENHILFSAIALVATITPGPAIMLVSAKTNRSHTILGRAFWSVFIGSGIALAVAKQQ